MFQRVLKESADQRILLGAAAEVQQHPEKVEGAPGVIRCAIAQGAVALEEGRLPRRRVREGESGRVGNDRLLEQRQLAGMVRPFAEEAGIGEVMQGRAIARLLEDVHQEGEGLRGRVCTRRSGRGLLRLWSEGGTETSHIAMGERRSRGRRDYVGNSVHPARIAS